MDKLNEAVLSDGKLLEEKFKSADGIIYPGELDYRDYSSQLVRKILFLQLKFSKEGSGENYDSKKVDAFKALARQVLTEVMNGMLTEISQREASRKLKDLFPRLHTPKSSSKNHQPSKPDFDFGPHF
ncbi:TPA: hypothetical protein HA244_06180 [Candidatus Micrarchaeota archaeon]|nr:hypothetical protein [Candidatus Micrarchaeota archaeon]